MPLVVAEVSLQVIAVSIRIIPYTNLSNSSIERTNICPDHFASGDPDFNLIILVLAAHGKRIGGTCGERQRSDPIDCRQEIVGTRKVVAAFGRSDASACGLVEFGRRLRCAPSLANCLFAVV